MASTTTPKIDISADYVSNPSGTRIVASLPDGTGCCNCYEYGFPCPNTMNGDKTITMTWDDYKKTSDNDLFVVELTKVPGSYKEYCDLKDMFSDTRTGVQYRRWSGFDSDCSCDSLS